MRVVKQPVTSSSPSAGGGALGADAALNVANLDDYPWYSPVDRSLAELILSRLTHDPAQTLFMVRRRQEGGYAISIKYNGAVDHIKINLVDINNSPSQFVICNSIEPQMTSDLAQAYVFSIGKKPQYDNNDKRKKIIFNFFYFFSRSTTQFRFDRGTRQLLQYSHAKRELSPTRHHSWLAFQTTLAVVREHRHRSARLRSASDAQQHGRTNRVDQNATLLCSQQRAQRLVACLQPGGSHRLRAWLLSSRDYQTTSRNLKTLLLLLFLLLIYCIY